MPTSEPAPATGPSASTGLAPRTSPLQAAHVALGARLAVCDGVTMPIRYTGEIAEARTVREAGGLFDLAELGEVCVAGPDAAATLDYATIGEISAIPIGRARYTMMCEPDGSIIEDMVIARLDATEFLVVTNTGDVGRLLDELRARQRGRNTRIDERTDDYAVIAIEGPRSARIVAGLIPADPAPMRRYATMETTVAGRNAVLARVAFSGEDGFQFYCAPDDAEELWYALAHAGEPHGIRPAGVACRDVLRLEAGIARLNRELTPAVTPYDAGLGAVVALAKDDFVGRAALAERAGRRGAVMLPGLIAAGRRAPRAGDAVLDRADGHRLGTVTSGAHSPTVGRPVAMAYLDAAAMATAADLAVDVRGRLEPVEVWPLPFYRRPRAGRDGQLAGQSGISRLRRLVQGR
jgi:aminomethyltransferase